MSHVFISYSRKDKRYVERFRDDLLRRGFDVWFDTSALEPSRNWWKEIERGIKRCGAFALVISPNSDASEWVYRELSLALHLKKPIFPLWLREHPDDEVLFSQLLGVQWEDVRNKALPPERFYTQLEHHVPRRIAQEGQSKAPQPTAKEAPRTEPTRKMLPPAVESPMPEPEAVQEPEPPAQSPVEETVDFPVVVDKPDVETEIIEVEQPPDNVSDVVETPVSDLEQVDPAEIVKSPVEPDLPTDQLPEETADEPGGDAEIIEIEPPSVDMPDVVETPAPDPEQVSPVEIAESPVESVPSEGQPSEGVFDEPDIDAEFTVIEPPPVDVADSVEATTPYLEQTDSAEIEEPSVEASISPVQPLEVASPQSSEEPDNSASLVAGRIPTIFSRRWIWGIAALAVIGIVAIIYVSSRGGLPPINTLDSAQAVTTAERTARNFEGSNTDWNPVAYVFPDDPAEAQMVLVPVGSFMMGSEDGGTDELPVHEQVIDEPFWIDRTEVTRGQYALCVAAGDCTDTPNNDYSQRDTQPINRATWFQARDYCAWRGMRLPTEAEWEYAARGPAEWVYPWGNGWNSDNAVYSGNSGDRTADAGSRPAGASWVGALDLSGNVWEWVSSLYEDYPYDSSHESSTDTNSPRVLRGGSFNNNTDILRAANRNWSNPDLVNLNIGFRCALP